MLKNLLLSSVMAMAMVSGANAVIIDDFTEAPMSISIGGQLDGTPCVTGNPIGNTCGPDGDDSSITGTVSSPVSQTVLDNESTPGAGGGVFAGSVLGGYRDFTTTLVQSPSASNTSDSEAAIVVGVFSHSQESGVSSHTYITWDGLAGAGGLSADLSANTHFRLVVLAADDGVNWSLQLFDSDSNFLHTFVGTEINVPTDLYIPFSVFTGIDFTDIVSIRFGANVNDTVDFDTSVGLLETVGSIPEPASMALLGAGLMGLGYFGKRRKA